MNQVLGIGAALVDLVSSVSEEWLKNTKVPKGGMTLVDFQTLETLLKGIDKSEKVPGGSASNTIVGLSKLGQKTSFLSKIKEDALGMLYENHLKNAHVESLLKKSEVPTGCVLSAVTEDAARTMFSFLGASDTLSAEDIDDSLFQEISLVYLEGYRAFDAVTFTHILKMAKKNHVKTAVDFGSFGVVETMHSLFENLFQEHLIDMIFANEDEAKAYTGLSAEKSIEILGHLAPLAVVKVGKDGAFISYNGEVIQVPAIPVQAKDTTGAGDLWAAGFLYAFLNKCNTLKAGLFASEVAAEVIQIQGASISDERYAYLKEKFLKEYAV